MRKCVILAMLLGTSPPVAAQPDIMMVYDVLNSHPKCAGPGKIAYRIALDSPLDVRGYLRGSDGEAAERCTVEVRKGGQMVVNSMPCSPNAPQSDKTYFSGFDFCRESRGVRPEGMRLTGHLVGCMTLEGQTLVDGEWKVTITRPEGSQTIEGAYNNSRFHADFTVARPQENKWLRPLLDIWIDVETVDLLGTDVSARLTGTLRAELVERDEANCDAQNGVCRKAPGRERRVKSTAFVCQGDDPLGGDSYLLVERYLLQKAED